MYILKISLKDNRNLNEFIGYFPPGGSLAEYLHDCYEGSIVFTGKESFFLSPEGDIIEITEEN